MIERVEPVLNDKKKYIDVQKTVQAIKDKLNEHDRVEFVTKRYEISRVGIIICRVEESLPVTIERLHADTVPLQLENREVKEIHFSVIFANKK